MGLSLSDLAMRPPSDSPRLPKSVRDQLAQGRAFLLASHRRPHIRRRYCEPSLPSIPQNAHFGSHLKPKKFEWASGQICGGSKGVPQSQRRIVGMEIAWGGRSYERSFAVLIIVPGGFQRDVLVDKDIHCGKR